MTERISRWFCAALVAVVVLAVWLPWMRTPLTLDETGSYWVMSGGLAQIVPRSILFPQSTLYVLLLWGWSRIFGISEFALRLPSLLASIATLWLLARIGARALGSQYRLLVPVLWLFFPGSSSLPVLARPYGFGMCMGAAALLAMEKFLSEGTAKRLWIFAVIAPLSAYFSILFLLALAGYGLFLLVLTFGHRKLRPTQCFGVFGLWIVMLLPLVPQVLSSGGSAAMHTIPNAIRSREDLFAALMPSAILLGLVAGLLITLIRSEAGSGAQPRTTLLLCALTVTLMSIVPLYVITQMTPAKLWASRYTSVAFPAMALLYGAILTRWAGPLGRIAAVAVPALLLFTPSLTTRGGHSGSYPEIVATLEKERQATGGDIYLMSQFAEGWRWPYPTADFDTEWLLAPYRYYRLKEPYNLLPNDLAEASPAEQGRLTARLQDAGTMVVAGTAVPQWLRTAVEATHSVRFVFRNDSFIVAVMERR